MASRGEELFNQLRTVQAIRALTRQTEDVHLDCKEWPAKDEDAQNFAKHIRRRSWRLLDELREFEVNPNISENDPDIQAAWLSSHAPGPASSSRRVFSGPSGSCRKLTSDSRQLSSSCLFRRDPTLTAFAQNDMPLDSCEDRVVRLDRLGNWE